MTKGRCSDLPEDRQEGEIEMKLDAPAQPGARQRRKSRAPAQARAVAERRSLGGPGRPTSSAATLEVPLTHSVSRPTSCFSLATK